MVSTAAREYVTSHFTPDIAGYLLGADGFSVQAEPGREGLGAQWQSFLNELAEAGHMRRSQSGRYWWASEEGKFPGRAPIGEPVNVRLGDDLLAMVDTYAFNRSIPRAEAIRRLVTDAVTRSRVAEAAPTSARDNR